MLNVSTNLDKLKNKDSKSTKNRGGLQNVLSSSNILRSRSSGCSPSSLGRRGSTSLGRSKGDRGRRRLGLALVRVTTDTIVLLKAVPRRTVKVLGIRVNNNTTTNSVELRKNGLVKVTDKVNGTANRRKNGETREIVKVGIVGNLETATNGLEDRETNVLKLRVGDNSKSALNVLNLGKVNGRKSSVDVRKGRVDGSDIGNVNGLSITEGHVVGSGKIGERNVKAVSGGRNIKFVNRLEGELDSSEVKVVVNVKKRKGGGDNAGKGGKRGIRNNQRVDFTNTSSKVDAVNLVDGDKVEVLNSSQLRKVGNGQSLENLKSKGIRDVGKNRSGNAAEGGDVGSSERALDRLDTIEGGSGKASGEDDITLKDGAASNGVKIRLGSSGDRAGANVA